MPQDTRRSRPADRIAWHPLLFAAYPVLFLWSQNAGETNAGEVLPMLALVMLVSASALAVVALPFRDARRAAIIVTPVVLAMLMYGHLDNLVHPLHVRPAFQQVGWAALVGLGVLAALRLGEARLRWVGGLLDRVAAVLVVVVLVLIIPSQITAVTASPGGPSPTVTVGSTSQRPLRDVYYLILDRYGADRSLFLRFGVQNDLTGWLTANDFRVLPGSHANYVKTTLSIASTLNMTHLADLAARMGKDSGDHGPIFSMLQGSRVVRQFKALGYEYIHIGSDFSPTRSDSAADHNLYLGGPSDFGAALYDTSALPVIEQRLHLAADAPKFQRAYASGLYDWAALASVRDTPGPKVVIGHFILPHPPYVFAADGHMVSAAERRRTNITERLKGQLAWTNDRLEAWIGTMLALPEDRRPIIILQADEGPYTSAFSADLVHYDWSKASPDDLQIKYGILNAWYLPDGTDPGLYDSMTSVNTFPVLFSGYFGLDIPKLEDREFTSAGKFRPYDLTDITDRLAQASP